MKRDIEKDLIEIECAIKSQKEKDNIFTMSVLQRCHKLVSELKDYKDLEEQGKLLKLPVAVGDTVYTLNSLPRRKTVIGETTADAFMCALGMLEGRFGKTIFLSLEEAEAALKELESKYLGEQADVKSRR